MLRWIPQSIRNFAIKATALYAVCFVLLWPFQRPAPDASIAIENHPLEPGWPEEVTAATSNRSGDFLIVATSIEKPDFLYGFDEPKKATLPGRIIRVPTKPDASVALSGALGGIDRMKWVSNRQTVGLLKHEIITELKVGSDPEWLAYRNTRLVGKTKSAEIPRGWVPFRDTGNVRNAMIRGMLEDEIIISSSGRLVDAPLRSHMSLQAENVGVLWFNTSRAILETKKPYKVRRGCQVCNQDVTLEVWDIAGPDSMESSTPITKLKLKASTTENLINFKVSDDGRKLAYIATHGSEEKFGLESDSVELVVLRIEDQQELARITLAERKYGESPRHWQTFAEIEFDPFDDSHVFVHRRPAGDVARYGGYSSIYPLLKVYLDTGTINEIADDSIYLGRSREAIVVKPLQEASYSRREICYRLPAKVYSPRLKPTGVELECDELLELNNTSTIGLKRYSKTTNWSLHRWIASQFNLNLTGEFRVQWFDVETGASSVPVYFDAASRHITKLPDGRQAFYRQSNWLEKARCEFYDEPTWWNRQLPFLPAAKLLPFAMLAFWYYQRRRRNRRGANSQQGASE